MVSPLFFGVFLAGCMPSVVTPGDTGCPGCDTGAGTDDTDETAADTDDTSPPDDTDDTNLDTVPEEWWTVCGGGADFSDIQSAVDAVPDGSTIYVCSGVWAGVRVIDRRLTIIGDGARSTFIIDATTTALIVSGSELTISGFQLRGTASAEEPWMGAYIVDSVVLLSDLTFAGNAARYSVAIASRSDTTWDRVVFENNRFGALFGVVNGTSVIRHCVIRDNTIWSPNASSLVWLEADDYEFTNNLIHDNSPADVGNWGLQARRTDRGVVTNNTLYRNGGATTVQVDDGVVFRNNIVAVSVAKGIASASELTDYNLIFGSGDPSSDTTAGTHALFTDPGFTDPDEGDFTLSATGSAGVDAGDPDGAYNDADGSRNDLGAFGGPGGAW